MDKPARSRSITHNTYERHHGPTIKTQFQHYEGHIIYKNTGTVDESLKNQVIDTSEDTYLKELKNKYTIFLRVTCNNILEHIINRYGNITTTDIEFNNQQMNKPITLSLPINKHLY